MSHLSSGHFPRDIPSKILHTSHVSSVTSSSQPLTFLSQSFCYTRSDSFSDSAVTSSVHEGIKRQTDRQTDNVTDTLGRWVCPRHVCVRHALMCSSWIAGWQAGCSVTNINYLCLVFNTLHLR